LYVSSGVAARCGTFPTACLETVEVAICAIIVFDDDVFAQGTFVQRTNVSVIANTDAVSLSHSAKIVSFTIIDSSGTTATRILIEAFPICERTTVANIGGTYRIGRRTKGVGAVTHANVTTSTILLIIEIVFNVAMSIITFVDTVE
jgi:hypothetical protein